jgi:hypothetical protein
MSDTMTITSHHVFPHLKPMITVIFFRLLFKFKVLQSTNVFSSTLNRSPGLLKPICEACYRSQRAER